MHHALSESQIVKTRGNLRKLRDEAELMERKAAAEQEALEALRGAQK